MATLADLRDRVIRETNRDELLDAPGVSQTDANSGTLDLCIQQAIKFYETSRFTFTESRTVSATAQNNEYVALPTGLQVIDQLSVQVGSNRYPLRVQAYQTIEEWNGYATTSGQPTDYAVSQDQIRLYPIPNTAYPLVFLGIKTVSPALDYTVPTSENAWTVQGYDLIAARTRYLLYRDYFRDDQGASIALGAQMEAEADLRKSASLLLGTGRMRGSW